MLLCLVLLLVIYIYQQLSVFIPDLKHQIRYVKECNRPMYDFYMGAVKYLEQGNKLPIYSNPYFAISGLAERYHSGKLDGYYALVFHDGDVAIYHNDDRTMLVYYKYLTRDILLRAGITQEEVIHGIEQARFYEREGLYAFIEKYMKD